MFRYEKKYVISKRSSVLLDNTLKSVLLKDYNSDGNYVVRSLYFEDFENKAYEDVITDSTDRVKYRIRCYNYSTDRIFLEEKRKIIDKIYKKRTIISIDEYESIIKGDVRFLLDKDELCKRFYIQYQTRYLRPKIIIEYNRTAYIALHSDLRITQDENVKAYKPKEGLFTESNAGINTRMDDPIVLEVKYRNFVPSIIPIVLSKTHVLNTNFSKYALSFEKLFIRTSWR